jgi:hypothetical protein
MSLFVAEYIAQDPLTSKIVLLIADSRAGCVRVLKSSDGSAVRIIGDKVLKAPVAVAVTQRHPVTHVIVGDSALGSICIFSLADGALLARIGTKGIKQGKLVQVRRGESRQTANTDRGADLDSPQVLAVSSTQSLCDH